MNIVPLNPNTPTPISKILADKLSVLTSRCLHLPGRTEIDIDLLPETRGAFESRLTSLAAWMRPVGPEFALAEVAQLFSVLGVQNREQDDRDMAMRVYARALSDLPQFALRKACEKLLRAHWMPSPGEIKQVAEDYLAPLLKEKREIADILGAKLIPKLNVDRAAVVAAAMGKLKGLADAGKDAENVRMGHKAETAQRKAETEAEREARLRSPMTLSPEVRSKFGTQYQEAAE